MSDWLDAGFDWLSIEGAGVFNGVVTAIRTILDGLETVLVEAPWPVVMTVIIVVAWRLAGPRSLCSLAPLSLTWPCSACGRPAW